MKEKNEESNAPSKKKHEVADNVENTRAVQNTFFNNKQDWIGPNFYMFKIDSVKMRKIG